MKASTRIKHFANTLLKHAGIQLTTTRTEAMKTTRLKNLQSKGHWLHPRYDQGLKFDDKAYLQFLDDVCLPYKSEYARFTVEPDAATDQYHLVNEYFGPIDAEVWYCMIRHFKPQQIIEVGSGFSTRLARQAIIEGQLATHVTCIDPQPRKDVRSFANEHLPSLVEDVPLHQITGSLNVGDVLFIDSSHTITTGGDVPFLFLEVLPKLVPGVLIHVHDIFFPFDYPEKWVTELRWEWNEQYLVQAFLCNNPDFDMVWPARFMWEYRRPEIISVIPSGKLQGASPSSLWLRKVR